MFLLPPEQQRNNELQDPLAALLAAALLRGQVLEGVEVARPARGKLHGAQMAETE